METRDLSSELEEAQELLDCLRTIAVVYRDMPIIDLGDEVEQAKELLGLLQAIGQEAA